MYSMPKIKIKSFKILYEHTSHLNESQYIWVKFIKQQIIILATVLYIIIVQRVLSEYKMEVESLSAYIMSMTK